MNTAEIRKKFDAIRPETKKKIVSFSVIAALSLFFTMGYWNKQKGEKEKIRKTDEIEEIRMDQQIREKSLYAKTQEMFEKQEKKLRDLEKTIKYIRAHPQVVLNEDGVTKKNLFADRAVADKGKEKQSGEKTGSEIEIPKPPEKKFSLFNREPPKPPAASKPRLVGGIGMISVKIETFEKTDEQGDKKKAIWLSPSFMEATLLSGLAAPTTNAAKNDPLPVLLRIKKPAVLPNEVKANLKGCFIIGSGIGNLADERVHIRIDTLSCISRNGEAVIDQPVKGFVQDSDGKVGLKGRVVAKMGVHIARSALAGFIEGFGNALSAGMKTSSMTALGQAQLTMNDTSTKAMAKAGLGEGIASASGDLKRFYLQLAEQTLPVIEVGSQKDVFVIIREGTELKIL